MTAEAAAGEGGALTSTRSVSSRLCNLSTARSACSGSSDTATFHCSFNGENATLIGSWTEGFAGTSSATCTIPLVAGETVARSTAGVTLTSFAHDYLGVTVVTDTNGGTNYSNLAINGGPITSVASQPGDATTFQRVITIPGEHRKAIYRGGTFFDHILTTSGSTLTLLGTTRATRVLTGSTTLYHNTALYTAVSTYNTVEWLDATCCYPTSGTITTVFTGQVVGTSTLTFSAICGTETYLSTSGVTSTLQLSQCD